MYVFLPLVLHLQVTSQTSSKECNGWKSKERPRSCSSVIAPAAHKSFSSCYGWRTYAGCQGVTPASVFLLRFHSLVGWT